jgi:predicted peptidase
MRRTHRRSSASAFVLALALLSIPLTGWSTARAQGRGAATLSATQQRVQAKSYTFPETGAELTYQLFVPTNYDAARPTPLVLALHGITVTPASFMRYGNITDLAEERGYIVVAPLGYTTCGWYGQTPPDLTNSRFEQICAAQNPPPNVSELSEKDVFNVLRMVREEYNIDANRIYLMGHSMGGGGAWYLGTKHPEIWAAIAPVAGAIYSGPDALASVRGTPVIVIHGDADDLVNVEISRTWVAKMRELGMKHTYVEVPGGDHMFIQRDGQYMRQIFDFFDQVRRN